MEHETSGNSSLHISDVIEVIQTTDPDFADDEYNPLFSVTSPPAEEDKQRAYVEIAEQPAPKALRFRYECEGRSAGSIPGVRSIPDNKTYPAIRVVGYIGRAVVVVSCVTKDSPYRPHPHSLVGKEGCKRGVCTLELSDDMTATFSNLGIQCVKKRDIDEALRVREEIRVDPFRTGFAHRNQPGNIDLNSVRLCFQVFLEGSEKGKFTFQLTPVVSDPIYDKMFCIAQYSYGEWRCKRLRPHGSTRRGKSGEEAERRQKMENQRGAASHVSGAAEHAATGGERETEKREATTAEAAPSAAGR